MLKQNIQSYLSFGDEQQQIITKNSLAVCEIFLVAELVPPYKVRRPSLLSLLATADHAHYRLVSNAIPVTDNLMGDTLSLRHQLGLPTEAQAQHVLDHLAHTACPDPAQPVISLPQRLHECWNYTARDLIVQDVADAYGRIVNCVATTLSASLDDSSLSRIANQLANIPWVMLPSRSFVRASRLVFGLSAGDPEDQSHRPLQS